jgi:hypothetical protein
MSKILFTLKTLIKTTNNFHKINKLGEEGFGLVYKICMFTFKTLIKATNNFHKINKLGEKGFGLIYKICMFTF